jgi:aminoglycoside phosphotransferase (APT) family kinase protein
MAAGHIHRGDTVPMTDTVDEPFDAATIQEMVRAVEPAWSVADHAPASGGNLPVQVLRVETPSGPERAVLKASPDDGHHGVDTEARLLGILDATTPIPVPEVYGAVDAHERLPSPFLLMEYVPGPTVERSEVETVPEAVLDRVARSTGRYLADLHGLDAVDAYGELRPAPGTTLDGGRPPASLDEVRVADPTESWQAQLQSWVEAALESVAQGRFADLTPALERALEDRIARLEGPFEPVVGHVDGSLENARFDPDSGAVTAMLDWSFTLAVTPGYDLVLVEQSLRGGPWRFLPGSPDPVDTVRPALLGGYRGRQPRGASPELRDHRELYELLSLVRSMGSLEPWLETLGATPEQVGAAAERLQEAVDGYL